MEDTIAKILEVRRYFIEGKRFSYLNEDQMQRLSNDVFEKLKEGCAVESDLLGKIGRISEYERDFGNVLELYQKLSPESSQSFRRHVVSFYHQYSRDLTAILREKSEREEFVHTNVIRWWEQFGNYLSDENLSFVATRADVKIHQNIGNYIQKLHTVWMTKQQQQQQQRSIYGIDVGQTGITTRSQPTNSQRVAPPPLPQPILVPLSRFPWIDISRSPYSNTSASSSQSLEPTNEDYSSLYDEVDLTESENMKSQNPVFYVKNIEIISSSEEIHELKREIFQLKETNRSYEVELTKWKNHSLALRDQYNEEVKKGASTVKNQEDFFFKTSDGDNESLRKKLTEFERLNGQMLVHNEELMKKNANMEEEIQVLKEKYEGHLMIKKNEDVIEANTRSMRGLSSPDCTQTQTQILVSKSRISNFDGPNPKLMEGTESKKRKRDGYDEHSIPIEEDETEPPRKKLKLT